MLTTFFSCIFLHDFNIIKFWAKFDNRYFWVWVIYFWKNWRINDNSIDEVLLGMVWACRFRFTDVLIFKILSPSFCWNKSVNPSVYLLQRVYFITILWTHFRSRDIVKAFARNKYYYVVQYNWWYHSREAKTIYM